MSRRKSGLRAFGLTMVAALGLMAFMAAGAQANWLLLLADGTLDELTAGSQLVKVTKDSEDFSLLIANVNLTVLCKKIEGNDLLLLPGTATTAPALGTVVFSECTGVEKSTGKVINNCKPAEPIEAAGKALVILHTNSQNYVLLEPEEGKPFTTIKFGELCALVETNTVTGTLVAECGLLKGTPAAFVQEDCKNHQVTHLLRQAPEELFPSDVLKYGTHVALIDGIAEIALAGEHEGLKWSGEA